MYMHKRGCGNYYIWNVRHPISSDVPASLSFRHNDRFRCPRYSSCLYAMSVSWMHTPSLLRVVLGPSRVSHDKWLLLVVGYPGESRTNHSRDVRPSREPHAIPFLWTSFPVDVSGQNFHKRPAPAQRSDLSWPHVGTRVCTAINYVYK